MATITYQGNAPLALIGMDKTRYLVPVGRPTDVPDEVWDRYKNRPDVQALIRRGSISVGGQAAREIEDRAITAKARLRKAKTEGEPLVNMPAFSAMTRDELIPVAKGMGIDLDPRAPKEDYLAAIQMYSEE